MGNERPDREALLKAAIVARLAEQTYVATTVMFRRQPGHCHMPLRTFAITEGGPVYDQPKRTKRLSEMKPGDRMWFEGGDYVIAHIEQVPGEPNDYEITFVDASRPGGVREVGVCVDGDWAVPDESE